MPLYHRLFGLSTPKNRANAKKIERSGTRAAQKSRKKKHMLGTMYKMYKIFSGGSNVVGIVLAHKNDACYNINA